MFVWNLHFAKKGPSPLSTFSIPLIKPSDTERSWTQNSETFSRKTFYVKQQTSAADVQIGKRGKLSFKFGEVVETSTW